MKIYNDPDFTEVVEKFDGQKSETIWHLDAKMRERLQKANNLKQFSGRDTFGAYNATRMGEDIHLQRGSSPYRKVVFHVDSFQFQ